ncbi:unnamed protein product [marine sediment metagenome]|uniref:Tyr recombinase domain-containing protein n=1 Tax=marine sediment metagenome TaxID=412755 RepID=X1KW85_9ZZZZ
MPDIDFDNRAIVIKVQKMRKKDGKAIERRRVVPIDQGTLDMVKEYLEWRKQFPYAGEFRFGFISSIIRLLSRHTPHISAG